MKLSSLKKEWVQILILAAPFCAVALLWDRLPNWVPIHWNIHGQPDDYARKAFGTLLLPVTNLLVGVVVGLLPLIDPRLVKYNEETRASLWRTVKILRLCITGFLSATSLAMLGTTLKLFNGADFNSIIFVALAILFLLMGNFMTKLRPNYFIGIRTPWTLESKEVWTRTHRLGGRLMMLGGLLMLVLLFIIPVAQYVFYVVLPVSLGLALFSVVYSYVLYQKEKRHQPTPPVIS